MILLERQRRLRLAAYRLYVLSVLRQQGWGGGVLPLVDVSHGPLKPVRDDRWEDSGQGPVGG